MGEGEGEGEGCSQNGAAWPRTPRLPPSLCYGAAGNPLPLAKGRGETNTMGSTTGEHLRIGLKSYSELCRRNTTLTSISGLYEFD